VGQWRVLMLIPAATTLVGYQRCWPALASRLGWLIVGRCLPADNASSPNQNKGAKAAKKPSNMRRASVVRALLGRGKGQ
jgi:hypothetical protein